MTDSERDVSVRPSPISTQRGKEISNDKRLTIKAVSYCCHLSSVTIHMHDRRQKN